MKAYKCGFALKVIPEDRSADVLHYLMTGYLLGGRSLDGVTWEKIESGKYNKIAEKRAKALEASMQNTKNK